MTQTTKSPLAVIISDIHYNMANLPLSDVALKAAGEKAEELGTPLIIAGDLHDTKAMLRAECVSAMLNTIGSMDTSVEIIPGNHDMLNERSEDNSLEFLNELDNTRVVRAPELCDFWLSGIDHRVYIIPYQHDPKKFKSIVTPNTLEGVMDSIPKGTIIICHQGVTGSYGGHYVHDKSAVDKDIFDGYRVISGHYHRAQDIKCGDTGLFSYIGSPFTMSFAEANDGPKGFRILYDDGSLELVPLNLRKHVIVEGNYGDTLDLSNYKEGDLLWIKLKGFKSDLAKVNKKDLVGHNNYKLDLISIDAPKQELDNEKMTGQEILDTLIDGQAETTEEKAYLKALWREITE